LESALNDPEFIAALVSEFSLTPLQVVHAAAELMGLALHSGRSVPALTRADVPIQGDAEVSGFGGGTSRTPFHRAGRSRTRGGRMARAPGGPAAHAGAPKTLGDVDVCAWHDRDPRLLLIECKRPQAARNVSEIVESLNQFRGASGDGLASICGGANGWLRTSRQFAAR
jgi:hypothetical protein